jgi:hypothetical protein
VACMFNVFVLMTDLLGTRKTQKGPT